MKKYKSLKEFLDDQPDVDSAYTDGALLNPNKYPLKYRKSDGTILFTDLPNFCKFANRDDFEEVIRHINKFFAWIEAERCFEGLVDKYIGDEIMLVFPLQCYNNPIKTALLVAKKILENDSWNYRPKIGIASGKFAVCEIGTQSKKDVTVIGHTVNIAARCVDSIEQNHIKVAGANLELIKRVFSNNNDWEIKGPCKDNMKGVGDVDVITIRWQVMRTIISKSELKELSEM